MAVVKVFSVNVSVPMDGDSLDNNPNFSKEAKDKGKFAS